jgi:ABC-2 type transport system permease protein
MSTPRSITNRTDVAGGTPGVPLLSNPAAGQVTVAEASVADAMRAARGSMPPARVLRAYLIEIRLELQRMTRAPIFMIPFVVLPIFLYVLFGVVIGGAVPAPAPGAHVPASDWANFGKFLSTFMFVGIATMAVAGPALFGVGTALAIERDQGLLRLKRAQPVPAGSYLLAKIVMQLVFATLSASAVALTALLAGKITFSAGQVWTMVAVLTAGSVPFCALGLFIGTHASATAAPGLTHLLYFPMLYLSGLFFPLPPILQPWAVVWPTFHLTQLAYAAAGVKQLTFMPPLASVGMLAGVTVIFGGLALRRLARIG